MGCVFELLIGNGPVLGFNSKGIEDLDPPPMEPHWFDESDILRSDTGEPTHCQGRQSQCRPADPNKSPSSIRTIDAEK